MVSLVTNLASLTSRTSMTVIIVGGLVSTMMTSALVGNPKEKYLPKDEKHLVVDAAQRCICPCPLILFLTHVFRVRVLP